MARAPQLSIVIPVYNEAGIVASAVSELARGLDARGLSWEMVLAENGSRDETPAILARLSAGDPRLRSLHVATPNYGAALKAGILEATGEVVFADEIDLGDLRFYDTALEQLRDPAVDMVVGSKAAKGAVDRRPWVRRLATRVHNGLLRLLLGFQGTDTHGLKAFRRERLLPVVTACVVDRDVFASELVIRAWRAGLHVLEIPIELREKRKPSVNLLKRVPNVLKNVAKLVWVIRLKGRA
ncbi:MAG TPA: glycosyltransferase family 2 protein [Myxococcaceae bacterium]|jgi:glycosyltransferase involved in cell wall biosynthesis|nr:glycosyltransferase family 2 protein [Myxococcaceae bacterium]